MATVVATLDPQKPTEIHPPELDDTYQDINSEGFSDLSDCGEEGEDEEAQNPALERLKAQSELDPSPSRLGWQTNQFFAVEAMFSEQDITDMYTYLKQAGMCHFLIRVASSDLCYHGV